MKQRILRIQQLGLKFRRYASQMAEFYIYLTRTTITRSPLQLTESRYAHAHTTELILAHFHISHAYSGNALGIYDNDATEGEVL